MKGDSAARGGIEQERGEGSVAQAEAEQEPAEPHGVQFPCLQHAGPAPEQSGSCWWAVPSGLTPCSLLSARC